MRIATKILFLLSLCIVVYWLFGKNNNENWGYFFRITIYLLTGLSMLYASKIIVNIFQRSVFVFVGYCFIVLGIFYFYKSIFWISFSITIMLLLYGIITRLIFIRVKKSDKYNENDNFIIYRKPKFIIEFIRAYLFVDSIGSIKIVKAGWQFGFRIINNRVHSYESNHVYNPKYYIYKLTNKDIFMKDKQYKIFSNNCLNCWNVDIKKELRNE